MKQSFEKFNFLERPSCHIFRGSSISSKDLQTVHLFRLVFRSILPVTIMFPVKIIFPVSFVMISGYIYVQINVILTILTQTISWISSFQHQNQVFNHLTSNSNSTFHLHSNYPKSNHLIVFQITCWALWFVYTYDNQ